MHVYLGIQLKWKLPVCLYILMQEVCTKDDLKSSFLGSQVCLFLFPLKSAPGRPHSIFLCLEHICRREWVGVVCVVPAGADSRLPSRGAVSVINFTLHHLTILTYPFFYTLHNESVKELPRSFQN